MEKLTEIQQKLRAPKGQYNTFGKYSYRSCEDILEAVKPLLNGCRLTISDAMVNLGDRYYVEATATFREAVGEANTISVTAYAREAEVKKGMDASQITGSTSSYARKYALNGLFLIDDTKDADTMNNTQPTTKDKPTVQHKKRDYITGEPKQEGDQDMSAAQRKFIKSLGFKLHEMTADEVAGMVIWKAEQENLDPNHWKVAKILLGDKPEENFTEVFNEYSSHLMDESQKDGIPY